MVNVKKKWRGYFSFSKRERNVGLFYLIVIIAVAFLPAFTVLWNKPPEPVNAQLLKQVIALRNQPIDSVSYPKKGFQNNKNTYQEDYSKKHYKIAEKKAQPAPQLFIFDPNKISAEEWMELGISSYVATRIVNYTSSGGRYKSPADLLKTYGFLQVDLDRLQDYILIEDVLEQESPITTNKFVIPENAIVTELNNASKEQLIALGFSGDNAVRILKFINAAGGVYSIEQIETIFGINMEVLEAALPFLHVDKSLVRKMNLNLVTFEALAAHPYISESLAQAIIDYRNTTGKFYSITELRKVTGMYPTIFEKLKPYLTL